MIPSLITNHKEQALQRLLEQYKDKPNVRAIIQIYSDQIQELEEKVNELFFTKNRLSIERSSGQQLDEIGEIIVQERGSNNDARYRTLLYAKVGINTSEGTPEDIISIVKLLTSSQFVHYINLGRAQMELEVTEDIGSQDDVNFLFSQLDNLVMAGVRVNEIRCHDATEAFGFEENGPNQLSLGFDEGMFAEVKRKVLPFAFSDASGNDSDPSSEGFGYGEADPLVGGEFSVS